MITQSFSTNCKEVDVHNNHSQMKAHVEIVTCFLVQNLFICSAFLWIFCESRHFFEIGTRLGASKGEFLQPYSTWDGVIRGNSGAGQFDHLEDPSIPYEVWIIIGVVLSIFLLMCIYCCMAGQLYRRSLWRVTSANPSRPGLEISPTVHQEDVRTSFAGSDVPPDYTVVVEQKSMAANDTCSSNNYPKVVGGKKLETPPPAYMTVAPFR